MLKYTTSLFEFLGVRPTALALSGLLMAASAWAIRPGGQAQFESASVYIPVDDTCVLHPEGNEDPRQAIQVRADADGVVRFQAVRPTLPNSVDRLALVCTDLDGNDNIFH